MDGSELSVRLVHAVGDESVRSFAQKAGLSPSGLRSVLKGTSPTVDTLSAICEVAGVSVGWLVSGECQYPRDFVLQRQLLLARLENFRKAAAHASGAKHRKELGEVVAKIEMELAELASVQLPSSGPVTYKGANAWLMSRVVDGIQRTYKETGASLPPASLGELAARIHNEIVQLDGGEDAWRGALALALGRLKTELTEVATNGTGKSSASS